jgi:hypothetical protein
MYVSGFDRNRTSSLRAALKDSRKALTRNEHTD